VEGRACGDFRKQDSKEETNRTINPACNMLPLQTPPKTLPSDTPSYCQAADILPKVALVMTLSSCG